MRYRDALKRGEGYTDSELKDVCVSITTPDIIYNLAFIEFETQDFLGIRVTRPDFTEGFVVLNKDYIISISVVYQGDFTFKSKELFDDPSYL